MRAARASDGRSAAGRTGHPHHRHERQGLDRADAHPAADGPGPDRRHVHQPAPGAGQRAHHPQRRADRRRGASPSRSPPSPTSRCWPACSPSYFEIVTAAAFRWFADVAVDVAVSRSACSGAGTPPTSSTARSRSSPTSGSTTPSTPARRSADIATEKAGIVKPGSTLVLGETDPELVDIFRAGRRPSVSTSAARTSTCVENQLALGGPAARPAHPVRRSTPSVPAAPRPPPGRQRRRRADRGRGVLRRAARPGRRGGGLRRRPDARALRGPRPPAARHRRRRPQPARRRHLRQVLFDDFDPVGKKILVVGFLAGRDPEAMLEALRADELDAVICCTAVTSRGIPAAEVAAAARAHRLRRRVLHRRRRRRLRRRAGPAPAPTTRCWSPARSTSSATPAPTCSPGSRR